MALSEEVRDFLSHWCTDGVPLEFLVELNRGRVAALIFFFAFFSFVSAAVGFWVRKETTTSASVLVIALFFVFGVLQLVFSIWVLLRRISPPWHDSICALFYCSLWSAVLLSWPFRDQHYLGAYGMYAVAWRAFAPSVVVSTAGISITVLVLTVVEAAGLWLLAVRFNELFLSRTIFLAVVMSVACLFLVRMDHRIWCKLYIAQSKLAESKAAADRLLRMLCDATLVINGDGDTILDADVRCEALLAKQVVGTKLSTFLKGAEERLRLDAAFGAARSMPTSIPITLVLESSTRMTVDCFIAPSIGDHEAAKSGSQKVTYSVGLRIVEQSFAEPDPFHELPADLRSERQLCPSWMCEPSLLSSRPETSDTARVFSDFQLDTWIDNSHGANVLRDRLQMVLDLGDRERWLLRSEDVPLQRGLILGRGSFGAVIGASLHGLPVAVKVPRIAKDKTQQKDLAALLNEIRILRRVRHPNIVCFFGACVVPSSGEISLVLERVDGPTLGKFVAQIALEDDLRRCQLTLGVASALRYLHAQRPRIVHGDLKGSNILVEISIPRCKLVDFGLSRPLTKVSSPMGGTFNWVAPELLRHPNQTPQTSADVFSFGRVVYLIATSREPLAGKHRKQIIENAMKNVPEKLVWPKWSPSAGKFEVLAERALNLEAIVRPGIVEIHEEVLSWFTHLPPSTQEDERNNWNVRDALESGASSPRQGYPQVQQLVGSHSSGLHRVVAGRGPTSVQAKIVSLVEALTRWNFPMPAGTCCPLHAAIRDFEKVVGMITSCSHAFKPLDQWQCVQCGIMDDRPHDPCKWCLTGEPTSDDMPTIHEEPNRIEKNSTCSL